MIRALADGKPGPNLGMDALHAMNAAQLAGGLLVGHIDEHLGSIRATVGA